MIDLSLMDKKTLAKAFDYSVLPKDSQEAAIRKGCAITRQYGFAAFCFSSAWWTPIVVEELRDFPEILIGAAISFPWGVQSPYIKAKETEEAIQLGATTLDMCMNVGALKDRHLEVIREEFRLFKEACHGYESKVILETCFLTDEEIALSCNLITEAGIDFAKTSSGQYEGPTLEQVLLMLDTVKGTKTKVKVAGVKFPRPQNAYVFLMAGVDRIGTRDAPAILESLDLMRKIGIVPPLRAPVSSPA
jgi:deoxyribose-phosphate aldolase